MKGKRRLLCQTLNATGLLRAARFARRRAPLLVLNYHRIRGGSFKHTAFDDGVFGPDEAVFRKQMLWLKRNTNVLSENDLFHSIRMDRPLPDRSTMITFDDGYRDCYEVALPILHELELPALFFIPTEQIENRQLGWWDLIAYAMKKSSPSDALEEIERCSSLPPEEVNQFLETLYQKKGVTRPSREVQSRELMSWDELRSCRDQGVAIGSHCHSHQVLSTLSLESQRAEFIHSRTILERRISRPVLSVAYPLGGYEHFHRETLWLAEETGYEMGFSFRTGPNRLDLDRYDIRRISPAENLPEFIASVEMSNLMIRRDCLLPHPESVAV